MLSKRESELMVDLMKGLSAKQIAVKNFISTHTVNTHLKNMKRKLNAKNNVDVVVKYLQNLENPTAYLHQMIVVVVFVFLQGFAIISNTDTAARRPISRVRISRVVNIKI